MRDLRTVLLFFAAGLFLVFTLFAGGCGCGCGDDDDDDDSDGTSPTLTIEPAGGLFNEAVEVTITATDENTESPDILFTLDGSDPVTDPRIPGTVWAKGQVTLTLSTDTVLKVLAMDDPENLTVVKTEEYFIDTMAPIPAVKPAPGVYGAPQTLTISAFDDNDRDLFVFYTLNGDDPISMDEGGLPNGYAPLSDILVNQSRTLKYMVMDDAGNYSDIITAEYYIDTEFPDVTANPAGVDFADQLEVVLTAADDLDEAITILYTVDGSEPSAESTATVVALSPATVTLTETTDLRFTAVDDAGNIPTDKTETYTLDEAPPVTSPSVLNGTYDAPFTVTLTAVDDNTDTPVIYYTTDGSEPFVGAPDTQFSPSPALDIAINGATELKYFAVDEAGNNENVKTESYLIDADGPTTIAAPGGGSYGEAQAVTLVADDDFGQDLVIYYTTDGAAPTPGEPGTFEGYSPVTGILIDANTELRFFAKDDVGNDGPAGTEDYVIDTEAPTVDAAPSGGGYVATQNVTLTATDDNAESPLIYYTLDGSEPIAGQPGTYMSASPVENLAVSTASTLKFFAVDEAGNKGSVATEEYFIDGQAPTVESDAASMTFRAAFDLTVTATDNQYSQCTIWYTLDGTTPSPSRATLSSPSPLILRIEADTDLAVMATDLLGNESAVENFDFTLDTAPPNTIITPQGGHYGTSQLVSLAAVDAAAGTPTIYYTLDGTLPSPGNPSTIEGTDLVENIPVIADTTISYYAEDEAGNIEQVKSDSFVIDGDDPVVAADPTSGTFLPPIWVTLTATDAGTEQCIIYYTTDGSAPTTSTPTKGLSPVKVFISATTTLKFIAEDEADNVTSVSTELYTLDTTAPATSANPATGVYGTNISVTLTATDDNTVNSMIYYSRNGEVPVPGTGWTQSGISPVSGITILTGVPTILRFKAVDDAGNVETVKTEVYNYTAPTSAALPPTTSGVSLLPVTLVATDSLDPAPLIWYRYNKNATPWTMWASGTGSVALNTQFTGNGNFLDGADVYVIEFYAVNIWGENETPIHSETYSVY